MYLNIIPLEKLASGIARDVGFTLKIDPNMTHGAAATSSKTIIMPPIPVTDEEQDNWLGSFFHEVGHHMPEVKNTYELLKDNPGKGRKLVYNAAVDWANEDNLLDRWSLSDKLLDMPLPTFTPDPKYDNELVFKVRAMLRYIYSLRNGYPICRHTAMKGMHPTEQQYVYRLTANNIGLPANYSNEAIKEWSERVIPLMDFTDEEKAESSDKGQGEQGQGDTQSQGNTEYEQATGSPSHTQHGSNTKLDIEGPQKAKGASHGKRVQPYSLNDFKVVTNSRSSGEQQVSLTKYNNSTNELRRIIQTKLRLPVHRYRKSGILDTSVLQDVACKSDRIFIQHGLKKKVNTAFSIAIDTSGSMQGKEYDCACNSAYQLALVLNALNIPTEICGFTTNGMYGNPIHYLFKEFNDPIAMFETRINHTYMNANSDPDSIRYAAYRLSQRKEKNKILVVMSDGMPSGGRPADVTHRELRSITTELIAHGIKSVGIGIKTQAVKQFYDVHRVVNDPTEIINTVVDAVGDSLFSQ